VLEMLVMASFFVGFGLLALWEGLAPARRFPTMRCWRLRGLAFLAVSYGVSLVVPLAVDEHLVAHRLFDATALGHAGGAAVGILLIDLGQYLWHRTIHRVPLLWRLHQLHHSAERIDIYSSMMFHPLDIAGFTLMSTFALAYCVGLTSQAALIAAGFMGLLSIWQHANVRTPHWLGYVVHRPESHTAHHRRGVHGFNYGGLALFDLLFGTFDNPRDFEGEVGFYEGASSRVGEMLLGMEVSEPADTARPLAA
jgi:sterol desaturase/sphingolipid hydroxylase (fatty acid hydroxylase superfamily)